MWKRWLNHFTLLCFCKLSTWLPVASTVGLGLWIHGTFGPLSGLSSLMTHANSAEQDGWLDQVRIYYQEYIWGGHPRFWCLWFSRGVLVSSQNYLALGIGNLMTYHVLHLIYIYLYTQKTVYVNIDIIYYACAYVYTVYKLWICPLWDDQDSASQSLWDMANSIFVRQARSITTHPGPT